VLSFYSSQLTSHASLIVGFVVAFFTLVQARFSILSAGFPPWAFELVVLTVVFAVVYSMFRLVWYGSLSGVLMGTSENAYRDFLSTRKDRMFPHAEVNEYAKQELITYSRVRSLIYRSLGIRSNRANRDVAFIIQLPMIVSFGIASIFASMMFGLSLDWLSVLGILVGIIVVANLLSIELAIPTPKGASG